MVLNNPAFHNADSPDNGMGGANDANQWAGSAVSNIPPPVGVEMGGDATYEMIAEAPLRLISGQTQPAGTEMDAAYADIAAHEGADPSYGARFRQKFTLEDALGSHACSLEALAGV